MPIALLFIVVGILGRALIHIPNVTPLSAICLLLPLFFSTRLSLLITLIVLILSDIVLHILLSIPYFGAWTWFTYSGWLCIAYQGHHLKKHFSVRKSLYFTTGAALFFWLWTNFGTWLCSTVYPHTATGLLTCYIAGLPFLRNSLAGDLLWITALAWLLFPHKIIKPSKLTILKA